MNDTYDAYDDEEDEEDISSWDEAIEKANEDSEGKATEGFIEACISYVQSVIRDKQNKGYLTNDEEYLPGYALDMLDKWEIQMTEELRSYRNESMQYIIDQIDEWEEKLNEEFP